MSSEKQAAGTSPDTRTLDEEFDALKAQTDEFIRDLDRRLTSYVKRKGGRKRMKHTPDHTVFEVYTLSGERVSYWCEECSPTGSGSTNDPYRISERRELLF